MANSLASPTLTNLLSELFAAADGDDEHAPPVPSGLSSWAQAPAAEQADAFQDCYIPISAEGGGGPQRGGDDPPGRCLRERGLPGGARHRDQLLDRALARRGRGDGGHHVADEPVDERVVDRKPGEQHAVVDRPVDHVDDQVQVGISADVAAGGGAFQDRPV